MNKYLIDLHLFVESFFSKIVRGFRFNFSVSLKEVLWNYEN